MERSLDPPEVVLTFMSLAVLTTPLYIDSQFMVFIFLCSRLVSKNCKNL